MIYFFFPLLDGTIPQSLNTIFREYAFPSFLPLFVVSQNAVFCCIFRKERLTEEKKKKKSEYFNGFLFIDKEYAKSTLSNLS